jgi:hypothetical protein
LKAGRKGVEGERRLERGGGRRMEEDEMVEMREGDVSGGGKVGDGWGEE